MSAELPLRGAEIQLAARPRGLPRPEDFRLVEAPVRRPGENEILVRNSWMSVDPSTRIRMGEDGSEHLPRFELGRPLDGWAVGTVIESRAARFRAGQQVLHPRGWRELAVLAADGGPRGPTPIEAGEATPAQRYLGALGWVGLTAYAGLLDVAGLRPGDVVFVSGAAGAVGSLAVQIAKLRGHTVIASAGSAAKIEFLREELGADGAFSYRDGDIAGQLAALAPAGIDVYFDNVGGAHLEAALGALRPGGRVALCGAISTYNEPGGGGPPTSSRRSPRGSPCAASWRGCTRTGWPSSAARCAPGSPPVRWSSARPWSRASSGRPRR